jgi:hypothetical protein
MLPVTNTWSPSEHFLLQSFYKLKIKIIAGVVDYTSWKFSLIEGKVFHFFAYFKIIVVVVIIVVNNCWCKELVWSPEFLNESYLWLFTKNNIWFVRLCMQMKHTCSQTRLQNYLIHACERTSILLGVKVKKVK